MLNEKEIQNAIGSQLHGSDGEKIGKVGQVYLDDSTGRPEWITVQTGMFGGKESFVPIAQAQMTDDGLRVPYDKATIKDAPNVDADSHLSPQQEDDLYRHYGVGGGTSDTMTTTGTDSMSTGTKGTTGTMTHDDDDSGDAHGTHGHETSGKTTDDAMTRSEERLHVGTEKREAGRARLRKYVVTENVTKTVPVTHEEVRIEREPITDANAGDATDGPAISEAEHEVVLNEERVVTSKETVPVERVRLDKEQVTEQREVEEEVRSEKIETDGDAIDVRGQGVRADDKH